MPIDCLWDDCYDYLVNKDSFQTFLQNLVPRLYHFALSMLPDELQAQQSVVDALQLYLTEESDSVLQALRSDYDSDATVEEWQAKQEICLFRYLLQIGRKRWTELQLSLQGETEMTRKYPAFFDLSVTERAVLHLKSKLKFPIKSITQILSCDRPELINHLVLSRDKLSQQMGQNFHWPELEA